MAIITSLAMTAVAITSFSTANNYYQMAGAFDPLCIAAAGSSYEDALPSYFESGRVTEKSMVTVLTHGMGGFAIDWIRGCEGDEKQWAEDGKLYYVDEFTLPYQLCRSSGRYGDMGFPLTCAEGNYFVFNESSLWKMVPAGQENLFELKRIDAIADEDINKHIVLLYDGSMGFGDVPVKNDDLFSNFKESLDVILVNIAKKQHDYLPSINLIGHSRGGIINLLYAIKYPKIVNNLISMGTPYMGSDFADCYVKLLNMLGSKKAAAYSDMLNPEHINEYSSEFNKVSNEINSLAIGFNQTEACLFRTLLHGLFEGIADCQESMTGAVATGLVLLLHDLLPIDLDGASACAKVIIGIIEAVKAFLYSVTELSMPLLLHGLAGFLEGLLFGTEFMAWLTNLHAGNAFLEAYASFADALVRLLNKYVFGADYGILDSDMCVERSSQLGLDPESAESVFHFTSRETITMGQDLFDESLSADRYCEPWNGPAWVVHGYEPKNGEAISSIISFLNSHGGFHEHCFIQASNGYGHKQMCMCGIDTGYSSHVLQTSQLNEDCHRRHCSGCSHFFDERHALTYASDETKHLKSCAQCGFTKYENHSFDRFKTSLSDFMRHTYCCECGKEGRSERHSFSRLTGRCFCGFSLAMDNTTPPPIGPIANTYN